MVRFLVWATIIIAAVIGILRLTAIRWFRIPTDDPVLAASVTPTLEEGDLVVAWRGTEPGFGSLVVCPDPEDPSRIVIGRIVGEPGDHVKLDGAHLWVNDERADSDFSCSERMFTVVNPVTGNEVEQSCDVETLGGVSHMRGQVIRKTVREKIDRDVGEDRVFLVSDNREFPLDSRHFGGVERDTCKESIFLRLVSRRGFMDVKKRLTYIR